MLEAIAFDNLHETTSILEQFRNDLGQIRKEGLHFKAFKSVVDGKLSVRTGLAYKRGNLRAYVNTDFKNDHRLYIEKTFTF